MTTIDLDSAARSERRVGTRCCDGDVVPHIGDDEAQQTSDELSLLANPIRLQILSMLGRSAGDVCVCDLEAALPVKQPTVSHHLRILREAGLIDCERRGLWAHYFLKRDALTALRGRVSAQLVALG
jgi:ArsR family transcriptional regulator, arsenate/arsenite/antimonite-responsive transcriptional repressor